MLTLIFIHPTGPYSNPGTFTCETNPLDIDGIGNKKFEHQLTVYEGLQCKDNVEVHKAGKLKKSFINRISNSNIPEKLFN